MSGPFGSRVLVEMSVSLAEELFPDGLAAGAPFDVLEAVARDVAAVGVRDEALAGSALAAASFALAREIANPYNSATSKSMCAREIREHMDRLRELLPPERRADAVDDLARAREARRAGRGAGA